MKILLIDDHEIFINGLADGLKKCDTHKKIEYITSIHQSTTVSKIINFIKEHKYDIVLIDLNIKKIVGVDGISLLKHISAQIKDIKSIIITGYDYPLFEYEAQECGAYAFVGKEINSLDLFNIIINVYNGNKCFKNTTNEVLILTEREREILSLYSSGYTRNEIAQMLYISPRTLANHLMKIYEKLDVSNYQEMIVKAAKLGYIKEIL